MATKTSSHAMNASPIYVMAQVEDSSEQDRLDLQHQIWLLTLEGKLHTTPLSAGLTSILDVGTGTGVWARSMARAFPQAEVIGTDLVPPAVRNDTPPNVVFVKHNADDPEWSLFAPEQFDFIHARMITSGIHDWPAFRAHCYRHLKPGGSLELLDLTQPLRAESPEFDSAEASPLIDFVRLAGASWHRSGLDYQVTKKHHAGLEEVGFVDITEKEFHWPIGSWPSDEREKKMGEMSQENVRRFVTMAGLPILTNDGFMGDAEAEKAVQAAKEDLMRTNEKKFYYLMKIYTARKPGGVVNGA